MSATMPAVEAGAAPGYAGIVSRGCALALDVLIVQASLFAIGVVIALIAEAFSDVQLDLGVIEAILGAVIWFIVFDVYLISFWALAGQTPGMRILGIELHTAEGTRVPPRRGVVRVIAMFLCAIPLFAGYLPILYNERRQGLHDKAARTHVTYKPPAVVVRRP